MNALSSSVVPRDTADASCRLQLWSVVLVFVSTTISLVISLTVYVELVQHNGECMGEQSV